MYYIVYNCRVIKMRKKRVWQNRTIDDPRGIRSISSLLGSLSFLRAFSISDEPNYTTNLMNEWVSKYSGSYTGVYIPRSMPCSGFCEKIKESISLALCRISSSCRRVNAREYMILGVPRKFAFLLSLLPSIKMSLLNIILSSKLFYISNTRTI